MRVKLLVDMKKLSNNIDKFLEKIDIEKFMAVVKANAYGLGIKEIVKFCIKKGIKWYAVATKEEAFEVYNVSKDVNILILSPVEKEDFFDLSKKNIHITVSSFDEISYILENNIKINTHLAFDTGMGRIGFNEYNIEKAIKILNPIGIYTHLSSADSDYEYTMKQLKIFDEIVSKYDIKYKHSLNSYGSYKYYNKDYDLYRIGIMMYGADETKEFENISSFYARVNHIKKLEYDSNIGYSNTYTAKKGDIIATIAAGYADGVNRLLSNNYYVYCNGKKYKIIGNICMDQFMILADDNIQVGDYVEIFGENVDILDFAKKCNTISYEVLCNISNRVNRIYRR